MRIYAGPTYALGDGDYVMLPGADLEVGPGGELYETLGQEEALDIVTKADAAKAIAAPNQKAEAIAAIRKMKRSLKGWLEFRKRNDEIAAGTRKSDTPAYLAAASLARDRDWAGEQKLAEDLRMLLSRIYPDATLPAADVRADSNAAVRLAGIALAGAAPARVNAPQATGILPILILTVGAVVLFTMTSSISNRAEVQKEKERLKCIQSGGCTDYGFWLKTAAVVTIGWFLWDKVGVGEKVRGALYKRGGTKRRSRRR